ncbi:MAG: FMN-binding glutamate synthase family protein [Betaproteobacteria bacterium]|nr:FMN-binding glutamate synthase family protein [Betaproteobacteria bacterium]
MWAESTQFLFGFLALSSALLAFLLGLGILVVAWMYVADRLQTRQAIRHNFPVIGRFRYLFEHLGEFFRQYFFAQDREELPFNRAERGWAYRAAKDVDNTVAFGSTRDIHQRGSILFLNCPYPTLEEDAVEPAPLTFGSHAGRPYTTRTIVNISGMSYGALSGPAVRALSRGAKLAGCWLNTGEGGLAPQHLEGGCDIVFQIGTAKYGVRDLDGQLCDDKLREVAAHPQVRMFEIKLSQGAKPGKGGILPGVKVVDQIARIRGIRVGQDSISPNRHPDINNHHDLLDMIERVRRVTGRPVGFKAVMGAYGWLDLLFEEIHRRGIECAPDFITVDGAEGGTGAAPLPLIDMVGLSLREGLPLVVDRLTEYGLRERVRVVASGKLMVPGKVAWALCMGADIAATARGFMFALGCIQALQCNRNTCPTGITTHNPRLQRGLDPADKAVRVANYHRNLTHEVGLIAHSCGVPSPRALMRHHAREVQENGRSLPLDQLFPAPASRTVAGLERDGPSQAAP